MADTWRATIAALDRLGATEAFGAFAERWDRGVPGDPLTPWRVYGGLVRMHAEWPSAADMRRALCDNHGGGVPIDVIDAFVGCCDPVHGD